MSYKVAPELSSYTQEELIASKAGPQGTATYDEMEYDPIAQERLSAESVYKDYDNWLWQKNFNRGLQDRSNWEHSKEVVFPEGTTVYRLMSMAEYATALERGWMGLNSPARQKAYKLMMRKAGKSTKLIPSTYASLNPNPTKGQRESLYGKRGILPKHLFEIDVSGLKGKYHVVAYPGYRIQGRIVEITEKIPVERVTIYDDTEWKPKTEEMTSNNSLSLRKTARLYHADEGEREWTFLWTQGGGNSVRASSLEEATRKVIEKYGHPNDLTRSNYLKARLDTLTDDPTINKRRWSDWDSMWRADSFNSEHSPKVDCVNLVSKKAEFSGGGRNFYRVSFRDAGQFDAFATPVWATRAAETMGIKYYQTAGCKIVMGLNSEGKWMIQAVLIPNTEKMTKRKALKIGNHMQDRLEKEGKWAKKACRDDEIVQIYATESHNFNDELSVSSYSRSEEMMSADNMTMSDFNPMNSIIEEAPLGHGVAQDYGAEGLIQDGLSDADFGMVGEGNNFGQNRAEEYEGHSQGYNDRMDESLGMRHRGKHSQSMKDRRDEASAMDKKHSRMHRKYDDVMTMDAQGYNDRMDESLGMRHRGRHSQSMKDRRDEASAMDKRHSRMHRKYDDVDTMDAHGGGHMEYNAERGTKTRKFRYKNPNKDAYYYRNAKGHFKGSASAKRVEAADGARKAKRETDTRGGHLGDPKGKAMMAENFGAEGGQFRTGAMYGAGAVVGITGATMVLGALFSLVGRRG